MSEWNPSQVALAYWFSFYDSIYEHPERPSQKIINNDDLLDKWVEDLNKEMEKRARKNSRYDGGSTRKALDYEEVIIFEDADDEYYDELVAVDGDSDGKIYEFDGVDYEE